MSSIALAIVENLQGNFLQGLVLAPQLNAIEVQTLSHRNSLALFREHGQYIDAQPVAQNLLALKEWLYLCNKEDPYV
jgi:hypothetical protein